MRVICKSPETPLQENNLLSQLYGKAKKEEQFKKELDELIQRGLVERIEDQEIVKLTIKRKDWCKTKKWPPEK